MVPDFRWDALGGRDARKVGLDEGKIRVAWAIKEVGDERRAPDASRTGALGWKGRTSMPSESLRGAARERWEGKNAISGMSMGRRLTTRGHHQQFLCSTTPCPASRNQGLCDIILWQPRSPQVDIKVIFNYASISAEDGTQL